jgi:DNA-binding protein H-NS
MPKTLAQLNAQIEQLQQQASLMQSKVVAEIKKQIKQYGLTAQHLFGAEAEARTGAKAAAAKRNKPGAAKTTKQPKFADAIGNTWGGMGKRPAWIREALESGRSLDEFLISNQTSTQRAPKAASAVKARSTRTAADKGKFPIQKPKGRARPSSPSGKKPVARKRRSATDTAVKD